VTHLLLVAPISALSSVVIFRVFLSPLLVYRKRDGEAHTNEEGLDKIITERDGAIRERDNAIHAMEEKTKPRWSNTTLILQSVHWRNWARMR
jgi:hypothetical protein